MKTSWRRWAPLALAGVSGAVFLNALGGQFVWDDHGLIVNNSALHHWASLPGFFTQSFVASFGAGAAAGQHESYRPLVSVTLLLDYQVWKLNPFGWHLSNLLMHAATTLAVYWALLALWPTGPAAFVGGLLFGLHPVHSEAVAFVANRPELVCGFFFALSAGAFLRFRKGGRSGWLAAALVLFAAALLSKETALILPLLLLAYDLTFWSDRHRRARYWWPYAAMLGVVAAYLGARQAALGFLGTGLPAGEPLLYRLLTTPKIVLYYLWILLAPGSSRLWVDPPLVTNPGSAYFWGAGIGLLALIAGLIRLRRSWPEFHLGGWWLLLSLGPVSGLLRVAGARMAERWLYIPSMGFALALAAVWLTLWKPGSEAKDAVSPPRRGRWLAGLILGLLLLSYAGFTIARNPVWHDNRTLFREMVAQAPDSVTARTDYGNGLLEVGDYRGALRQFREAAELNPGTFRTQANLGFALMAMGRIDEAIAALRWAARLRPEEAGVHVTLGGLYLQVGNRALALREAEAALRAEPGNLDALELRERAGG